MADVISASPKDSMIEVRVPAALKRLAQAAAIRSGTSVSHVARVGLASMCADVLGIDDVDALRERIVDSGGEVEIVVDDRTDESR